MKRTRTKSLLGHALGPALVLAMPGCDDLVVSSLLLGAREGALTTTTGIIEGFFEDRFGLEAADASGIEGEDEESGDGLFIRL